MSEALRMAVIRVVLGQQQLRELPTEATNALVAGVDSPALRELAGARPNDELDNRDLFLVAMRELGIAVPAPDGGHWEIVRFWAKQIVIGTVTPYDGAQRIWWDGWEMLDRPERLVRFVGLASEWEDFPAGRPKIEQQIVEEAASLVDDGTTSPHARGYK